MQLKNNAILDLTNKASESILRVTVVELLEDATVLAKDGATPDQLMAFLRGTFVMLEAARSLALSHTGEDNQIGVSIGLVQRDAAAQEDYLEEIDRAYQEVVESYSVDAEAWEKERLQLVTAIENCQAEIAQLSASKNGHRTLVKDEYELKEDDLPVAPVETFRRNVSNRTRRGNVGNSSSRDRVRELLASRRVGSGRSGQGFGRRVRDV